jgi:hypothetical protein
LEINMPNPLPRTLPAVGWNFSLEAAAHKVASFFVIIFEVGAEAQRMRLEARRRYPMMDE